MIAELRVAMAASTANEPPSLDAMLNSLVYILEAHKAHVKTRRDWALLFAHSYLLATDFSLLGLQSQQQQQQSVSRSSMLPAECWSDSGLSEDIVLAYRHKRRSGQQQPESDNASNFMLGLITMGDDLIVSLSHRDTAASCAVPADLLSPVDASLSSQADQGPADDDCLRRAYPAVERLHRLLWEQLFLRLAPFRTQQQQEQQQRQNQQPIPMPHRPLPGSPGQQPLPQPMRPQAVNPFDYGRADLDPFGGGGGGGMRFDPLRIGQPRRPGQPVIDPSSGQPLPPGAVPPGARFDPFGPGQPGGGGGGGGGGPFGFADPDPDNLRPPGWGNDGPGFGRGRGGFGGGGGNFYM